MADNNNSQALGAAALGAAGAAILLRRPSGGDVVIDTSEIVDLLTQIKQLLQTPGGGGTAVGYRNNVRSVRSLRVVIGAVADRFPTLIVPDDMELKIKAGATNAGICYIGESQSAANNVNQSEPLVRGEVTRYKVHDAYEIWFSGTAQGDTLVITAEQE